MTETDIRRIVERKMAEAGHPVYQITDALAKIAEETNPVVVARSRLFRGADMLKTADIEHALAGFNRRFHDVNGFVERTHRR